jgi:hypothetical protein
MMTTLEKSQSECERIHAIFLAAGLVEPRSPDILTQPSLLPEREAELAEKLAKAGSLSELITQEREEQDDRLLLQQQRSDQEPYQ